MQYEPYIDRVFRVKKCRRSMFHLLCVLLAALWLAAASPARAAEKDVGIVLLHGKWDRPPLRLAGLARKLEAEGFLVAMPTMPWSSTRDYDVSYTDALKEIDGAATVLMQKGAKHLVVGGQSLGGNGTLAYAGSGRKVDAIFVLSPGHTPDRGTTRQALEPSVRKARFMVEEGSGKERAFFDDINQGKSKQIRVTAESYLSYFDPDGMGSMAKSAAAIPSAIPIFMAVGLEDRIVSYAQEGIFQRAPAHPQSAYLNVQADHEGVPAVAASALIAWLKSLNY